MTTASPEPPPSGARQARAATRTTARRPPRREAVDPARTVDVVDIANRLRPVLIHINRHLRRELATLGVTGGQVSLLSVIHGSPGIGAADLAARELMSTPTVCGHVDRLEAAGLVTRARAADGDRRRVGLRVTAEGERVLRAVRSRRTAWLAARLADLDPADVAAVEAAVGPLRALIEGSR